MIIKIKFSVSIKRRDECAVAKLVKGVIVVKFRRPKFLLEKKKVPIDQSSASQRVGVGPWRERDIWRPL